ncbi:pre-mRNA splicing factor [Plasmodium ovale curtisi]|uniref:Pre-mRNA splicing factor n=1 Tax=Plasmodium ovale curtisi TaxID=864141 RepID=A0A1A8W6Y2_PLAOA|nr:pre-mRNA splicing factor [Plasmodium ovale curtisi]
MENNYNNGEYSAEYPGAYPAEYSGGYLGVTPNTVDQNDMNKQMYDYYYYNNPDGTMNNKRGYGNMINDKNFNSNKNIEDYYNYYNDHAYVGNICSNTSTSSNTNASNNPNSNTPNDFIYGISGNYGINYSYMDSSYYPMNNDMHPMSNPMHPMSNPMHPMSNPMHPMSNPMHPMSNQMHLMSSAMHPFNRSLNRFPNKLEESMHNYHFNAIDQNAKAGMKYKIAGNNITSVMNSSFQSSLANYNTEDKKSSLEMTNTTTYNVNTLLRNNILSSEYFRSLITLKTFKEVVDEIHSYADHVEPYCIGSTRAPSTLFCCLYKLFTMHLSEKQVSSAIVLFIGKVVNDACRGDHLYPYGQVCHLKGLIDHKDSCYIRACGFLYLRYVHSPANVSGECKYPYLWTWFEPYLLDEEEFIISADKRKRLTMGEYVQNLLSDDKYFNTVLPRLPIKIKNIYGARLMIINDHRKRSKKNKEKISKFVKGEPVMAYVNGEWEKGEIGGIVNHGKEKISVRVRKIDGNERLVNIGYVKLGSRDSDKEKDTDRHRSTDRSRSKDGRSHRKSSRSRSGRRRRKRSRGRSRDRGRDRGRDRSRDRSKDRGRGRSRDRSRDKRRRRRESEKENHSSHNKSHGDHRGDRSVNRYSKRSHERSNKKRDRSVSKSESEKRGHRKEKNENTEDELINKFRKIESQKALATGKDYARRPTSYKSSLTLKVENISTRKKSRSRSPRRIDRTVQLTQTDSKSNENVMTENSKLKELMQKYNKEDNEDDVNNENLADLEEMDVMTLG